MQLFGRRHHNDYFDTTGHGHGHGSSTRNKHYRTGHGPGHSKGYGGGFFHRKNDARVAAGYKAALVNPNTTKKGRERSKDALRSMGYNPHVSLMTKIKRTLGIRSTLR